ncbi:MAG: hypothetical protein ABDH59_08400 [Fervidobacterium sp.]
MKKSIYDDLPLYRFFKIYFVGSTEKAETTKKTGDYLLTLKPFDNVSSDEEALARAVYLSYWEAKLNNRYFDEEIVKNSPVFNEFFSQYQIRVSQAFGNFVQDFVAYIFGLDIPMEDLPKELEKLRDIVIKNYKYEKVYNGEEKEAIRLLLSNPELVKIISDTVSEAKKNAAEYDPETLIMRTRASIFRSAFVYIAGLKDKIATQFVMITPREINLAWLRWVIYGVLLAIGYIAFKNINLPFKLFIASETVYVASFFNMQSTTDGMIYGITFAIAIISSILYFFAKKLYSYLLLSVFTLIVLFIPSFFTEDLVMKDTFSKSPFFKTLSYDIFEDSLGKVQRNLKEYNSTINESIQAFSNLISELNIDTNVSEEYFEPQNFSMRIELAKKLRTQYKDHVKEIEDFIYFESNRQKKVEKIVSTIKKIFARIVSISSSKFKNQVFDYVKTNFSDKIATQLLNELEKIPTKRVIALPTYKISGALSSVILLSITLFLTAMNLKEAFIPLAGSLATSILALFKYQTVFIQVGVPSISLYVNFNIPYTLVLVLIVGFIWFYPNILRRRERV